MPKAKTLDRLELTRQKMQAREDLEAKRKSPFLKMVAEMIQEHPELHNDFMCPICGGSLVRYEGCYRCKKCGWSRC
ncbi:MAG: hypothetical protein IKN30_05905 [Synergistaceae bacterium]|nr:hypothetical protein [Synergistaceae bacterium]